MSNQTPDERQSQKASHVGRNVTQVGRDYTQTTNISLLISFFIIGITALGGLAWSLNIGHIQDLVNSQSGQQEPQQIPLK